MSAGRNDLRKSCFDLVTKLVLCVLCLRLRTLFTTKLIVTLAASKRVHSYRMRGK